MTGGERVARFTEEVCSLFLTSGRVYEAMRKHDPLALAGLLEHVRINPWAHGDIDAARKFFSEVDAKFSPLDRDAKTQKQRDLAMAEAVRKWDRELKGELKVQADRLSDAIDKKWGGPCKTTIL